MPTLGRELRRQLERTCIDARRIAEQGAEKAIRTLAVGEREPHRSMTAEQKALRNRLRAHGRQLGDGQNAERGTQELERLTAECAYEHWHRMLFARYLAANNVLIEPVSGEAISLEEVKELAHLRGQDWVALAGEFAVRMLPQVFRQDDPVLEIQLAGEDRKALEEQLQSLPADVFLASDSLGWCYQFWQAERKDDVNDSGARIGPDELAAVTQLFTEDYMVDFLLDNTLGAWHAAKILDANPKLATEAEDEVALRKAVALPGCPWNYLRFIKNEQGRWTPAAGVFEKWPRSCREIRALDPCMGSGHFVVALFERLVALRAAETSSDLSQAVDVVIQENVFGLEIDPRCTQLAAFNLALAAWRLVGYRTLPPVNIACSGLAPNMMRARWLRFADDFPELRFQMGALYDLFDKAPVLGSLINPRADKAATFGAGFAALQPVLAKALQGETADERSHEMAVTARGLAQAAELLSSKFTLVVTNVPFLGRNRQIDVLKEFAERVFPEAKQDLATCFVERCLQLTAQGGTSALVTPQSWLFQDRYGDLRRRLLATSEWQAIVQLGAHAFETISGERVNVSLLLLGKNSPDESCEVKGWNVASSDTAKEKALAIRQTQTRLVPQRRLLSNPDARIVLEELGGAPLLLTRANSWQGIKTSDDERFTEMFWEQPTVQDGWCFYQRATESTRPYAGREEILFWQDGYGQLTEVCQAGASFRGKSVWGKAGVAVSMMGNLPATLYTGEKFSADVSIIEPKDPGDLAALWAYCSSEEYATEVRKIDRALRVTNSAMAKIPFDVDRWRTVATEKWPRGLPKAESSDPTQWLFDGQPVGADEPLQVAVARLLGYRWPRQTGWAFVNSPAIEVDDLEALADDDGIVSLGSAKGEIPGAQRLRSLLACSYGNRWNAAQQEALLDRVGYAGSTIDEWLKEGFFEQHCALFLNRPFVWHLWDGRHDGFHALVSYHALTSPAGKGRQMLEKLTFSYVGDWIARQKAEQRAGAEGADAKVAAASHLQAQLKAILEGEPPFDLFVRWKPLHEQPIGWEPDANDGLRINVRPFMMAKTLSGRSIFRKAPKIKWEKDRGKEPERSKIDFPWYWDWDEVSDNFLGGRSFDGNRWNDLHYSCVVKREARARQKEKKR